MMIEYSIILEMRGNFPGYVDAERITVPSRVFDAIRTLLNGYNHGHQN